MITASLLLLLALTVQGPAGPARAVTPPSPATVTGRVGAPGGAPAVGMRVGALDATNSGGDPFLAAVTRAGDDGRYTLEGLPPGRYYIFAGPLELPTYFPGETALGKASAVTATAGETVRGVDFSLAQVTLGFKVSGRMVWHAERGRKREAPALALIHNDTGSVAAIAPLKADETFEFANVLPGLYFLMTNIEDAPGPVPVSVHVRDEDVTGVEVVVPRMVQVTGLALTEDGRALPPVTLWFIQAADGQPVDQVEMSPDGIFRAAVPSGEYRLRAAGLPPGFYLKSLVAGSEDLLQSSLRVKPTDAVVRVIAVVASAALVEVGGRVTADTRSMPARIEIRGMQSGPEVPGQDDFLRIRKGCCSALDPFGPGEPEGTMETAVNPDGTFLFSSVLPGGYTANLVLLSGIRVPAGAVTVPETGVTGLQVSAPPLREIMGRVSVEGGGPAPRFSLMVLQGKRENGNTAMSGFSIRGSFPGFGGPESLAAVVAVLSVAPLPDGTFRFTLPEGEYSLLSIPDSRFSIYQLKTMTRSGADLLRQPLNVATDTAEELRITFALDPRAVWSMVAGRVTGLDPATQGSARVGLTGGGIVPIEAPLAADGSFEFPKVPPGSYMLQILPAQALAPSLPIAVTSGHITGLQIAIPKPRRIRGRVLVEAPGTPIGFNLALSSGASVTIVLVRPGSDGAFDIVVPEGRFSTSIQSLPAPYKQRSLTFGPIDLTREVFEINAASTTELLVSLALDGSAPLFPLNGRVTGVDLPGNARIVLIGIGVPVSFEAPLRNGGFAMSGLLPNVYRATVEGDGKSLPLESAFVAVGPRHPVNVEFGAGQSAALRARKTVQENPTGVSFQPIRDFELQPAGDSLNSNESAAVANLRTINTAEITYLSSSGGKFADIADLISAGLLDTRFRSGVSGYRFTVINLGDDYWAVAVPGDPGGGYAFFTTPDGVVRFASDQQFAPPGVAGEPVQ